MIREYINQLLDNSNLVQVPDDSYITYIKTQVNGGDFCNVRELIQYCEAIKVEKDFQPLKKELVKKIETHLIKLFDSQETINGLVGSNTKERAQDIRKY